MNYNKAKFLQFGPLGYVVGLLLILISYYYSSLELHACNYCDPSRKLVGLPVKNTLMINALGSQPANEDQEVVVEEVEQKVVVEEVEEVLFLNNIVLEANEELEEIPIPIEDLYTSTSTMINAKLHPVSFVGGLDVDTDLEEFAEHEASFWTSNYTDPILLAVQKTVQKGPRGATFFLNYSRKDRKDRISKETNVYTGNMGFVLPSSLPCPLELAKDAKFILGAELNAQSASSTVVFCVLLRNKYGFFKKFAFHNRAAIFGKTMRNRAEKLGYDIIQADQSHAEGQFLQFLYKRCQDRPGFYTHIMGMGCSKKHCAECDSLMRFLLSPNYTNLTAAVNDGVGKTTTTREITRLSLPAISLPASPSINSIFECKYEQTVETSFKLVKGQDAVDTATYPNYYLPNKFRDLINNCLYYVQGRKVSFKDERFTSGAKEGTERSKR